HRGVFVLDWGGVRSVGRTRGVLMRFAADSLRAAAQALLAAAGMDEPLARDVADVLVEGDLLGHDTHGLALLAPYLAELEAGRMARQGSYRVMQARGAAALWDGGRLAGAGVKVRDNEDGAGVT